MEDKPVKRALGGPAIVAAIVVLFVLLPLVYLLAIGPIVWLHERGLVSVEPRSVIGRVYYPAEFAAQHCTPFRLAVETYVSLWRRPEPPVQWAPAPLPAPPTVAAAPNAAPSSAAATTPSGEPASDATQLPAAPVEAAANP
jgi:hypothetical protein